MMVGSRGLRHVRFAGVGAVLLGLALPALAHASGPTIVGCPVFPPDNIWNTRVDGLPVDPRSREYAASIGADAGLHPDFGAGQNDGARSAFRT